MVPSTQAHAQEVNDLIVSAANLRIACDLCARVAPTDEIVNMHKIFERQMVENLRSAAELLSTLTPPATAAANTSVQKSEPSPIS